MNKTDINARIADEGRVPLVPLVHVHELREGGLVMRDDQVTGACPETHTLFATLLAHIAANEVANRPGRIEPRVLKRHRDCYPHMQRPRAELQAKLCKT